MQRSALGRPAPWKRLSAYFMVLFIIFFPANGLASSAHTSRSEKKIPLYIKKPLIAYVTNNNSPLNPQSPLQDIADAEMRKISFPMNLTAGQYIHVVAEPLDADFLIELLEPDGRKVLQRKSRISGPTPISWIAESSGVHKLEITGKIGIERIKIKFDDIRKAGASDRNNIAAEEAFAEGESLYLQWKKESIEKAISCYEKARNFWRTGGYRLEEADTLDSIGDTYFTLSRYKQALDQYQESLGLSKSEEYPKGEVRALNNMSHVQIYLGDINTALQNCSAAFSLSQEIKDQRGEVQSLNLLGFIAYLQGDLNQAIEYLDQALALLKISQDRLLEVQAHIYLGVTYADLSNIQTAIKNVRRGIVISREIGYLPGEARGLTALGGIHNLTGEFQQAIDANRYALELFSKMGNSEGEAVTSNNLGGTYELLGETDKALEHYKKAYETYSATGFKQAEAITISYIGRGYSTLGHYDEALEYFEQGLLLTRAIKDRLSEGSMLHDIGTIYNLRGEKQKALSYFTQALSLNRSTNAAREEAKSLNQIGRILEDTGDTHKALEHFNEALSLSRTAEDHRVELDILYNIARLEFKRRNYLEASSLLGQSIRIIESLRTNVAGQEFRASYFGSVRSHYDLYIDLLMHMHRQDTSKGLSAVALQASERARARTLLEILVESRADITKGVDSSLLKQEQAIRDKINAKAMQQAQMQNDPDNGEKIEAIEREIDSLSTEREEVQSLIRGKSPRYAALTQPEPLDLPQIQTQILDNDTLLLEYALGEEQSYLWAVTKTSFHSFELSERDAIEKACQKVLDLLLARQARTADSIQEYRQRIQGADSEFWKEAAALSQILLGPAADLLEKKRIVVVAEGILQYIPFEALPEPHKIGNATESGNQENFVPLIVDHEIVNLPSASVLAVLRDQIKDRPSPSGLLAVLADPVFEADDPRVAGNRKRSPEPLRAGKPAKSSDSVSRSLQSYSDSKILMLRDGLNFQRLPATRQEAGKILALCPADSCFRALDFKASRATAMDPELAQYRIIHFATHGFLNSRHPGLSALVLSTVDEQGHPQNGFLRLADIYNLDLPVDLIVLSACDSGLGKEVRGEALMGIVRGFMYAGAASVISSLWKVDDRATSELMQRFYRHMIEEKKPAAAALHAAQVEMWEQGQWRFPFYWAGFTLQGEWK